MPRSFLLLSGPAATRCRVHARSAGFALPVAVGASLLLLLSSSSLQLLALQSRVQASQLQQRHQREDTLASAAHQQAGALLAGAGCLLTVDQAHWVQAAQACQLSPAQFAAIQQGTVAESRYRVSGYRLLAAQGSLAEASTATAELELQLLGGRPWRAAFRVHLAVAAEGWQITAVQPLGLRGAGA